MRSRVLGLLASLVVLSACTENITTCNGCGPGGVNPPPPPVQPPPPPPPPPPAPTPKIVREITISPQRADLKVGQEFTFTVQVKADSGVSTSWTCQSTNAAVATVLPVATGCKIRAIWVSPQNGGSPIQITATTDAVHPELGKLQAGAQLFVTVPTSLVADSTFIRYLQDSFPTDRPVEYPLGVPLGKQ